MHDAGWRSYRRIATLKNTEEFSDYLRQLGVTLGIDRELSRGEDAPLQRPYQLDGFRIGNRFCVLPMEGWDGTLDGRPSELTTRRWQRFGESGAKLIWGGEAVAVRQDGRANPHQLLLNEETLPSLDQLRRCLLSSHEQRFGSSAIYRNLASSITIRCSTRR
jgi:NADPH2 dehydrogenase